MMLAFGKYAVCLPLFHYMTRQEVVNADEVLPHLGVLCDGGVLPRQEVLCDGGVLPRQEVLYDGEVLPHPGVLYVKRDLHMLK